MKSSNPFRMLSALAAGWVMLLFPSMTAASAEDGVEVLTRGPVHEAFAEAVSFDPQPGLIVTSAPPEPIEELPLDQRPDGENVAWIPGYWAWDDDWNDFLWISGVWRNLPPGRQWVPGYWDALDGGRYQWISGYWADSTTAEMTYISTVPPQSVDAGPNIAAPSEDHSWVPGNWIWVHTRYVWRPGYWLALRPDWTWVPARYCWTPRGYLYLDGYWDYAVARRGLLFAPVHFHRRVYLTSGYCYRPSIVVGLNVFSHHLFIRPRCGHYYFGDYYAPRYHNAGFYASFAWHSQRHCYDPIYAHHRWHHRHDRGWERRRHDDFNYFRDNERARPPHTWAAMRDFREDRFTDGRNRRFARPFADVARAPERGQRFVSLEREGRDRLVAQRQEMRNFGQQRREIETRRTAPRDDNRQAVSREAFRRSPFVGRQPERFARNEAPPQRPEARIPNFRPQPPAGRDQARPVPPGVTRGGSVPNPGERQARPLPGRPQDADRGSSGRGATRETPQRRPEIVPPRQVQPRPEVRPAPERRPQAIPQRPVTQRPQVTPPQRPTQPAPQVRPAPERRPQAVPPQQARPQPQVRPAPPQRPQVAPQRQIPQRPQVTPPQRTVPPQARPTPPQRPQAAPQRQVQPRPQIAPQRQAPQRPQVRPAPQPRPQAAPQRQAPSRPQVRLAPQQRPQAAPQRQAQPNRQDSDQRGRRGR